MKTIDETKQLLRNMIKPNDIERVDFRIKKTTLDGISEYVPQFNNGKGWIESPYGFQLLENAEKVIKEWKIQEQINILSIEYIQY